MTAIGRAGSKVILLGEHGVVHGKPAFVCGRPQGMTVEATPGTDVSQLSVDVWQMRATSNGSGVSDRALAQLLCHLPGDMRPTIFRVTAAMPHSAGLGASASLATACARAYGNLYERVYTNAQLRDAVHASETVFHQTPSGIDAAAVREPGLWVYQKAVDMRAVRAPALHLLIVHSGVPGQTRQTVATFARQCDAHPAAARDRLDAIELLVNKGVAAATAGDTAALGKIMNENHRILQWFGVSTPALDSICTEALRAGAMGAKLTGGGGGGCAVVLVSHETAPAVRHAIDLIGYGIID